MKSPKQKWLIVYNAAKIPSEMIGIRVFGDARVNWYSYMPGAMGLTALYSITNKEERIKLYTFHHYRRYSHRNCEHHSP